MIVAKYKFDKSIYENLIPVFNDGYEGYTITDEIDENDSNVTIRTIECDSLPTKMKFGDDAATDRELSLLEILDMNINEVTSLRQMFMYCENLTSITCDWNINNEVTSLRQMFYNCKSLTLVDVSRWDTSNVNNIRQIFYNCENLTQIDVSNWNTSLVDDMNNMFYDCKSLTSIDMSNWNTNLVDDMSYMFYSCDNLIQLDLSNFDTSKVTNIENMFYSTSSLQYIRCNNTSTINTLAPLLYDKTSSTQGKIITTSSTNVDTTTLSSLNWSVDTSSGTKLAEYVYDKSIWNYLVPEFNEGYSGYFCNDRIEDESKPNIVTRELVGYGGLPTLMRFGRVYVEGESATDNRTDSLLEILDMNTSGLTNCDSMFRFNKNLTSISCNWDTKNVTDMNGMFIHCTNLTSLDVSNFDTSKVSNMQNMFNGCKKLISLDVSNFNTSNVTNMYNMFINCTNLTSIDVSKFNTSNVTRMAGMFAECYKLTSLDVSNFDTSNVTNMGWMFNGCKNLTSLDVSNFNTSNVKDMSYMFQNCYKLTSLDVSNWDTSNVTTMHYMFYCCQSLTILDIGNWNTNKLTHLYTIFADCINLKSLNLSNWNISNIMDLRYLINGCNKLKTLDISNWNFNSSISFTSNFSHTPLLTDIGMIYCSQDTINKIIPLITDGSKTIWVKDTKASDYTATDYVTIKDYKEDNRTLYLNSPLLEGDEIVNKDGKLYHYHKMGKVVLDGSENWKIHSGLSSSGVTIPLYITITNIKKNGYYTFSNNFVTGLVEPESGIDIYMDKEMITGGNAYNQLFIRILKSKLLTTDENGFKQWLSENPTTIIYELAEPYYELISDDPLIVQSYAEGKLDTSSIISPTSIQSVPYEEELTYLYTSTQYCIQFNSTANCTVDITLGGTKVESKSVSVGLNKIYITTPSTLVDNKLIINSKGSATISEVVVVNSNAEFDYFDGMKSSFEDCLVTDVDNENYSKYEVGVRIIGKNKFNGYAIAKYWKANFDGKTLTSVSNDNKGWIYPLKMSSAVINYNCVTTGKGNASSAAFGFCHYDGTTTWCAVKPSWIGERIKININKPFYGIQLANYCDINWSISDIQLEEGSVTTSYEPYKETNATVYLNSPLLKGDRIEVVDDKLCHYHKMGKVVLDGSENEEWNYFDITSSIPGSKNEQYYCNVPSANTIINTTTVNCINDRFPSCALDDRVRNTTCGFACSNNNFSIIVEKGKYYNSISDVKQWLSENPTTIIYELAEPYYEDITPIQSSFVISTVSEGDMEIITDLPIKSNITYLTNITSAVLMEQQLDELDNGTESLTNIVEDKINE